MKKAMVMLVTSAAVMVGGVLWGQQGTGIQQGTGMRILDVATASVLVGYSCETDKQGARCDSDFECDNEQACLGACVSCTGTAYHRVCAGPGLYHNPCVLGFAPFECGNDCLGDCVDGGSVCYCVCVVLPEQCPRKITSDSPPCTVSGPIPSTGEYSS